ncbi:MAG TPA: 30S ribosomal protein S16 [Actinobacteria bacterium]|nr:30S ribosomal protein S16 [Actinomycetota bacterium]
MAVKIRLKRMGKKKQPTYRVVVADSRSPRDGRIIESIGRYDPRQDPSLIEIDGDRALYWLQTGAQPTERAKKLLEINGTWAMFRVAKGEVYTIPATVPEPVEESAEDEEEPPAAAGGEAADDAEPAPNKDAAEEVETAPEDPEPAAEVSPPPAETDSESETEDAK